MKRLILAILVLAGTLAAGRAQAGVSAREEVVEGRKLMILENDLVRLGVLPDPGGTVIEFINKKTGVNFVAGRDKVLKGRLGWGWKDFYSLENPEQFGKVVFSLPYKGEFRKGPGYQSIFVSCEAEGQLFEREMRLSDTSAELTTLQKITNIGKEPRRLQCRWHTYSQLDDQLAENSCIIVPGSDGQARKCFIGSGWDHQFITGDGFWMAVNYKSGQGIWMTFKREQSSMQISWTDYSANYGGTGSKRGEYVAEPHPQAFLAQPGQSVQYESTFYPFTVEDKPESIPLGMLSDPAEKERARQFLMNVKPNLAAIGPYTMTPGDPPAGLNVKPGENRFSFNHRRRDRFTLRPWGILDAMMAVPSVEDQSIRCRYYARVFDSIQKPMKVSFVLKMIDPSGKTAKEQKKDYTIDPAKGRELDVRDDVPMSGLADGWYKFTLEGFVEGEKEPVHTYVENRRLVGQMKPGYEKMMAEKEKSPLAERPFVTALRKIDMPKSEKNLVAVPIGVEDGSGIARKGWPVRCGVPFAQGMLPKESVFELKGPDGKSVPVQTAPMATWLDGSLKWVLVDFPADVAANGHVFYTLTGNPGKKTDQEPLVTQNGEEFKVPGGSLKATDLRLFGLFGPEDLWWEDGAGQKYYFRLIGDGAGMSVVENGVNRAVIKAAGWYVNDKNRPVCLGELRMEYYRGKTFRKLEHTVTFGGDPWKEKLGSYGIRFQLPEKGFESVSAEFDGKTQSGKNITVLQRSSDGANLTVDGKELQGVRAIGAVEFTGKTNAPIGVYHRNFWQMAPKKLVADAVGGTVAFSYWPSESGAMSFLPREDGWIPSSSSSEAIAVGMSRTHEIFIDFADTKVEAAEKYLSEPVVAIVPPKYLAQTKAMLHLSHYDPERYPELEQLISSTIDFYASQRELFGWYGEWVYGGIPNFWNPKEYRWFDFGRYAWILNEGDIAEGPWLCFMRSGDRKYLKFAEINTRHLMEVGTIRWNPTWPNYVGLNRRHHECIWLSSGDTGHSMLDPFLDCYYATGYRPAWEAAERMAGAMSKVTSGSWRYISNPVAGLSRMYIDTQNPYYKEHADRIWNTICYPEKNDWWLGDHGDRMTMWYSQINPQCKELWKQWSLNPDKKDRFVGMDVLSALYLETGDPKYGQAVIKGVPAKRPEDLTQHVFVGLRSWCYTGELLSRLGTEAKQAPSK
jgi:hypothetical protein